MSINDLVDDLESAALSALAQAGAIKGCPFHSDVTIRIGKTDAERRAYAIATIVAGRLGNANPNARSAYR
jgi:hypothetical protein